MKSYHFLYLVYTYKIYFADIKINFISKIAKFILSNYFINIHFSDVNNIIKGKMIKYVIALHELRIMIST